MALKEGGLKRKKTEGLPSEEKLNELQGNRCLIKKRFIAIA